MRTRWTSQRATRVSTIAVLVVALMIGMASWARAESAAPIGRWIGENTGDQIVFNQGGKCSVSGMVNVEGTCQWKATTSTGGILTLNYVHVLPEPAHIYYNVTWINPSTILVNSVERFKRQ